MAHRRSLHANALTRVWPCTVWPVARVLYSERVGVRTALNRIVREDRVSFRQRCLDGGQAKPDAILEEVQWIEAKYDLLPRGVQRRLQREWEISKPIDPLWDEEERGFTQASL